MNSCALGSGSFHLDPSCQPQSVPGCHSPAPRSWSFPPPSASPQPFPNYRLKPQLKPRRGEETCKGGAGRGRPGAAAPAAGPLHPPPLQPPPRPHGAAPNSASAAGAARPGASAAGGGAGDAVRAGGWPSSSPTAAAALRVPGP